MAPSVHLSSHFSHLPFLTLRSRHNSSVLKSPCSFSPPGFPFSGNGTPCFFLANCVTCPSRFPLTLTSLRSSFAAPDQVGYLLCSHWEPPSLFASLLTHTVQQNYSPLMSLSLYKNVSLWVAGFYVSSLCDSCTWQSS